ncbi:hypothetical protein NCC49_000470 [Naganishia albida]|nr:hypothetical protein NCC49_000470 [Naganishia albida]
MIICSTILDNAYFFQLKSFEAERAAAREELSRTERELPSPSREAQMLPGASSKKNSNRPSARRKRIDPPDGPDKDGLTQTRIQPERSARLNAQVPSTEPPLKKAPPPKAADEIMREWPSNGRTEVIITNGDFFRLEEAEYLNDILIEFGLKYEWSKIAEEALEGRLKREDIHVFNSFFYKKLSARNKPGYKEANPDEPSWPAYETVRKWTNKVNVFEKKMLVVPINENLHWYLAVILNPGAILQKTLTAAESVIAVEDDAGEISTEAQKEAVLSQQLEEEKRKEEIDQAKELAERSDEKDPLDIISNGGKPTDIDADSDVEELPTRDSGDENAGKAPAARSAQSTTKASKPVLPTGPVPLAPPSEWPPAEEGKSTRRGPINPPPPKLPKTPFNPDEPVIMTFDSLSASHQPVGKLLNKWLVYEALDKAKENTSLGETDWDLHFPAAYKTVRVPGQDNFADCGVYVLHYAIQLMKDDGRLREYIFENTTLKSADEKEKNKEMWKAKKMSTNREMWKSVIESLPVEKGELKKEGGKSEGSRNIEKIDEAGPQPAVPAMPAKEPARELEKETDLVNYIRPVESLGDYEGTSSETDDNRQSIEAVPKLRIDTSRGTDVHSSTQTRSSPSKRTISISPLGSQDGPVNKRRKIAQPVVEDQDVCQDSQSEPSQDPLAGEGLVMEDGVVANSQTRSTSPRPRAATVLAQQSPEIVALHRTPPSAMQSLTNELSEVQMSEALPAQITRVRPSMPPGPLVAPPMSPVNAPLEIRDVPHRNIESTKKETTRDKLRRNHDAEPARSPKTTMGPSGVASHDPAGGVRRAGSPTKPATSGRLTLPLDANSFPCQPSYLDPATVGVVLGLRDTAYAACRGPLLDENEPVLRKLQRFHNPTGSPMFDFGESDGAGSTYAPVNGAAESSYTSANGHDGNVRDVVDVSSDGAEDVEMQDGVPE